MEVLTFAGLPSVLFLDVPTPEQLARFGGGAGDRDRQHGAGARDGVDGRAPAGGVRDARGARGGDHPLQDVLDARLLARGRARSGGRSTWRSPSSRAPGRRCWSRRRRCGATRPSATSSPRGRAGVSRLDRHPVMARHPVTPMDEADVPRHLARQTERAIGLVTLEDLATPGGGRGGAGGERRGGAPA